MEVEDPRWSAGVGECAHVVREVINAAVSYLSNSRYDFAQRESASLVFLLSNDLTISSLNKQFRGKDGPTDVLSFPNDDIYSENHLGDIVVSYDTIMKDAVSMEKDFTAHLKHILLHGFLHLLGYNHINDGDAKIMESLEVNILSTLGIKNIYNWRLNELDN